MKIQMHYIHCSNQFGEKYRISYCAFGNPNAANVALCIHGLNRNNRDFDFIAEFLTTHDYYIIAPDLPGRGNSDYLADYRGYGLEANVVDIMQLVQQLQLVTFDVIGVSLGGVIGMMLAALPQTPVRKMILNDIGAEVEINGVSRIAAYCHEQPDFASFSDAGAYLRSLSLTDGIYDEVIWQHMFINSFQKNSRGRWELKRDQKIANSLAEGILSDGNILFWPYWEKVLLPTLIIHGASSDLLLQATITKMQHINPQTELLVVADAGHSPYLYRDEHIRRIGQFLLA